MELKIISPNKDMELAPVTWNYEELKAEIKAKTDVYKSLVVSEDQISTAKSTRADLNRLDKALNDEKIRVEKMYLDPYESFENQINELRADVKAASSNIDRQVKEFEEKEREAKLERCLEMLLDQASKKGLAEFKPSAGWESLIDPKWGNKSKSYKSIEEEIDARLTEITSDLEAIDNLTDTPFIFELKKHYERSLNLGQTLQENERLKRQEEEKKAHLERQQSLLEAQQHVEAERPMTIATEQAAPDITEDESEKQHTLQFEVTGTEQQLMALSSFMRSNNITFTQIKE